MATGWAIIVDGEPDLRTVGPTERSAMVNGLVALMGVFVTQAWTDVQIARTFVRDAPANMTTIRVDVTVAE